MNKVMSSNIQYNFILDQMRHQVVKAFLTEITSGALEYYFFYANPFPWSDANDLPTTPTQTVFQELSTKSNIIGLKQITANDILLGLKKHMWEAGVQYKQYEYSANTIPLSGSEADSNFVFTSNNNIYLCLDNGSEVEVNAGVSKIAFKQTGVGQEPNHTSGKATYDDGYTWQFMYSIDLSTLRKFNTPDYIPIDITAGDNPQAIASAIPGTVDRIDIVSVLSTGGLDTYGGEGFSLRFRDPDGVIAPMPEIPIYVDGNGEVNASASITIREVSGGTGAIDIGNELGSNALNGVVDNLYPSNTTNFDPDKGFVVDDWGSGYHICANTWIPIKIRQESSINNAGYTPAYGIARVNDEGILDAIRITRPGAGYTTDVAQIVQSSAVAYASVNTANTSLKKIRIETAGTNFTKASAIPVTTGWVAEARLAPVISPPFGHGSNPEVELDALAVILNVRVKGDANNLNFSVDNSFRTVGIITSVNEYDSEDDENIPAQSAELTNMISLRCKNPIDLDKFVINEFIVGDNSGGIARIVDIINETNTIRVIRPMNGANYLDFEVGENIYLLNDPTIESPPEVTEIIKPTYQPLSGTLLFINNREAVERSSTQIETFNFILTL